MDNIRENLKNAILYCAARLAEDPEDTAFCFGYLEMTVNLAIADLAYLSTTISKVNNKKD